MFWPSFAKGSILKQNMLEALRDNPYIVLKAAFSEYGDGIISGFEICSDTSSGQFLISPGIVKIGGELHVSAGTLTVEQIDGKHYVYLAVQHIDNPDGAVFEFKGEQYTEQDENGFELFRYTKNAEMFEYKDIREVISAFDSKFDKPVNRINKVFCRYAAVGGSTLHPDYFRLYAKEILKGINANQSDIAFAYHCLNGISNIEIVKQYFNGAVFGADILKEMKMKLAGLGKTGSIHSEQPKKPMPMRPTITVS